METFLVFDPYNSKMLPAVRIYSHNIRFILHPFIYCRHLRNTSTVINGELNHKIHLQFNPGHPLKQTKTSKQKGLENQYKQLNLVYSLGTINTFNLLNEVLNTFVESLKKIDGSSYLHGSVHQVRKIELYKNFHPINEN